MCRSTAMAAGPFGTHGMALLRQDAVNFLLDRVDHGDLSKHLISVRQTIGPLAKFTPHVRSAEGQPQLLSTPVRRGIADKAIDRQDASEVTEMDQLAHPCDRRHRQRRHRRIFPTLRTIVAGRLPPPPMLSTTLSRGEHSHRGASCRHFPNDPA